MKQRGHCRRWSAIGSAVSVAFEVVFLMMEVDIVDIFLRINHIVVLLRIVQVLLNVAVFNWILKRNTRCVALILVLNRRFRPTKKGFNLNPRKQTGS